MSVCYKSTLRIVYKETDYILWQFELFGPGGRGVGSINSGVGISWKPANRCWMQPHRKAIECPKLVGKDMRILILGQYFTNFGTLLDRLCSALVFFFFFFLQPERECSLKVLGHRDQRTIVQRAFVVFVIFIYILAPRTIRTMMYIVSLVGRAIAEAI